MYLRSFRKDTQYLLKIIEVDQKFRMKFQKKFESRLGKVGENF